MSRSPSMLVLTNYVYAKRKDGTLFPGSIEGKYDGNYTVMFGDSTREIVLEENVTWLAFWGLPPWCWPKNPVIQAIGKKSVGCANFQEEYVDVRKHRPASLTVLKNNDGRKSFPDNLSPPLHPSSTREHCCRTCQSFVVSSRQATKEDVTPHETLPTRSSVLRLNKKALHKDLGLNYVDSFPADTSSTGDSRKTDGSGVRIAQNLTMNNENIYDREYVKNKRSPNDRVTTPMNMTKVSKSGNDEVTKWKSYHSRSSDMTKRKRRIEDRDTEFDENEMLFHAGNPLLRLYPDKAYQSCDWYDTSPFKQVVPTPPITPSSPSSSIELELPVFGQAAQKINWTSEEWMKNTSATGIGRRRRDDLKKCRKIYGVENRHLWCTQCRWKKACTRFKA